MNYLYQNHEFHLEKTIMPSNFMMNYYDMNLNLMLALEFSEHVNENFVLEYNFVHKCDFFWTWKWSVYNTQTEFDFKEEIIPQKMGCRLPHFFSIWIWLPIPFSQINSPKFLIWFSIPIKLSWWAKMGIYPFYKNFPVKCPLYETI